MAKIRTAAAAAVATIHDGAMVAVNASSGLLCPDAVLARWVRDLPRPERQRR